MKVLWKSREGLEAHLEHGTKVEYDAVCKSRKEHLGRVVKRISYIHLLSTCSDKSVLGA
jgi:hypothetical protein